MSADEMRESFDDFYRVTNRRLLHQLYVLTASASEAQDCVQEAYARAWQRWPRVQSYADPEAWVRTVARRIAVSRWRRTRTALAHLRGQVSEPSVSAPSEDHALLVTALRQITLDQREAIVLHHLCGRSVEQVAAETGAAVGTVKARLHRGRAALATVLGDLDSPDTSTQETRRG